MSFLGGVRWADLSSDTHSLSAAPPFCPGLDENAVVPCPSAGALSPHPSAFLGQTSKKRGHKNASDTAEALLLQCDAAAEQSYLNPSSSADLGCSNAGINLHFREAARLGCSTPVDEDVEVAGDAIGTYAAHEGAGRASVRAGVDASASMLDGERGRERRVSNCAQQQRGGQANPLGTRRGRGSASGGGSVCAGFKGLLASTKSVGGGGDGGALCTGKKWSRARNANRTTTDAYTHVSDQRCATSQNNSSSSREMHERTEPQTSIGTTESSARKSGCDNNRTGDRRGDAHRSTKTASATRKEHQKACGQTEDFPGGTQKYCDAKGTGRPRDIRRREHPSASRADAGRSTEAQRILSPDVSNNWRASCVRKSEDLPATELHEQVASCECSHGTAPKVCTHEPQPERRLAQSAASGGENGLVKGRPEQPLVCSDMSAQESPAQQQQPREERAQQQEQHSLASSAAFVRESRETDGRGDARLAARKMTPAKRHRPPVVGAGREGRSMVLQSTREGAVGEAPAAEVKRNPVSVVFADGMEDARAAEDTPAVEERWHDTPTARTQHSDVTTVEDCKLPQETTTENSTATPQAHVLQGPPPRKKKRGATETSKRISAEVVPGTGVSCQSGDGIASASGATIPVLSTRTSSGNNSTHGEQRRDRKNSFLGAASATTGRGLRRNRAGGNEMTGEEYAASENVSVHGPRGSVNHSAEGSTGAAIAGPSLLQFAAQACPLLQVPGTCFATPPYIMVPVAAATPLTTSRRSSNGSTAPGAALHPAAAVCGPTAAEKKSQKREQHNTVVVARASRPINSAPACQQDEEEAEQEWARRTSARMKDIAVGKATEGYKNFIRIVPKDKRRAGDPATPDPKQRCSKAKFQRELLDWRKQLHRYDGCCPPDEYGSLPDNSCSSGGAASEWNIEPVSRTCSPAVVGDYRRSGGPCDANSSCEGGNFVLQNSCGCTSSAVDSSIPSPLFSTPPGSGEQAATGAAAFISHPDPIEQFNRECERIWL